MKHPRRIRGTVVALSCLVVATLALPAASGFAASGEQGAARHVVVFSEQQAPAGFVQRVDALGGTVLKVFDEVGFARVGGLTDAAARELRGALGVSAVEPDLVLAADALPEEASADVATADPEQFSFTCDATATQFCRRQWNLRKIEAQAAWANGPAGRPVVKAFVLDTGIDYLHPDLAGLVDLDLSISLVSSYSPEDELVASLFPTRHAFTDLHSHGTAIAGLISSNAKHLAGVTHRTTLVAVKVHDRFRLAPISVYLEGILYAANNGADVMHLSIPREFDKRANPGLVDAVNRAINYAYEKGAVMVAAAGNCRFLPGTTVCENPSDRDLDRDIDRFRFCNAVHVICLSATGPTSAAGVNGPWANPDAPAGYSNFGRSAIDVAGPGGTAASAPNGRVWLVCSRVTQFDGRPQRPCREGGLIWSSTGTSFAAGATSGLAALLVSIIGKGKPDAVQAVIRQSAEDLGAPGTDPYYGKGRINVARALDAVRP